MKFMLLHGNYVGIDGRKYKAPALVEADSNLMETFGSQKFSLPPAQQSQTPKKESPVSVTKEQVTPSAETEEDVEKEIEEVSIFEIRKDPKVRGWFNVINTKTGQKANDTKLRKIKAQKLCDSLNK